MKLHVLLVDDDPEFIRRFECLGAELFGIASARSGGEALEALEQRVPDAVLLDVDLGHGMSGIEVLERIRRTDTDLPVIMISGDERPETIVAAMRAGATDYVSKRPNLEILRIKVRRALDEGAWRIHARQSQAATTRELTGTSRPMHQLREEIAQVAPRSVRVLVTGETGTGKELVAAASHAASPRARNRFVVISGATGSDELFDAQLFGHEKGAFTGADRQRIGRFELAAGGTLFLDEIAKMPQGRQAKLLRVIESGRVERVGGTDEIECDVRIVAASNEDLDSRIRNGAFLADLYYRLAEYRLTVPPLRDRLEDLPALVAVLLDRFARNEQIPRPTLPEGEMDPLFDYPWPGNVRELDGVLKRATIIGGGGVLTADLLRAAMSGQQGALRTPQPAPAAVVVPGDTPLSKFIGDDYDAALGSLTLAFDRLIIERALRGSGGNVTRAAHALGVSRSRLHVKLRAMGLARDEE